jgi:hypothetical protein
MADDHDRAEFVRLVSARCPELSIADLEDPFGDGAAPDASASVLAEIADAVAGAIDALEERLDILEKDLPRRVH